MSKTSKENKQDIEITFDDGRREIHLFDTVSFYAITSMFSCLLSADRPDPDKIDPEGELNWLLEKIHITGITKIRFGTFRTMSFVTSKLDDGTLGIEVRFHLNKTLTETEEKILRDKPKITDLLEGLLSGRINMEVLTPDDLPEGLSDALKDMINGLTDKKSEKECKGCPDCDPKNHSTH